MGLDQHRKAIISEFIIKNSPFVSHWYPRGSRKEDTYIRPTSRHYCPVTFNFLDEFGINISGRRMLKFDYADPDFFPSLENWLSNEFYKFVRPIPRVLKWLHDTGQKRYRVYSNRIVSKETWTKNSCASTHRHKWELATTGYNVELKQLEITCRTIHFESKFFHEQEDEIINWLRTMTLPTVATRIRHEAEEILVTILSQAFKALKR